MTIRFKDFRTIENYGDEIYTAKSLEEARQYMKDHEEMRFMIGGGKIENGDYTEIYWNVVTR